MLHFIRLNATTFRAKKLIMDQPPFQDTYKAESAETILGINSEKRTSKIKDKPKHCDPTVMRIAK